MNLSPADQVKIRRLLLLREAAFDEISRIEESITELAGGFYPLDAPEVVPISLQKKKAKRGKGKGR